MNNAHNDDAITWRGLTDQLTPEQVAELECCDRVPPGMDRSDVRAAMRPRDGPPQPLQAMQADIAPPPEARGTVYDWVEWGEQDGDRVGRMCSVSSRTVGEALVEVCGVQYDDKHIDRKILLSEAPEEITTQRRPVRLPPRSSRPPTRWTGLGNSPRCHQAACTLFVAGRLLYFER